MCYECPKFHRWADLREPWPSLAWETLESQYNIYVPITFDQQVQLAIGGIDQSRLVTSQRPHHMYSLPKINKCDILLIFIQQHIYRGDSKNPNRYLLFCNQK